MVEKTVYESAGKIVLESGTTGIMISAEHYADLAAVLTDDQIFESVRY